MCLHRKANISKKWRVFSLLTNLSICVYIEMLILAKSGGFFPNFFRQIDFLKVYVITGNGSSRLLMPGRKTLRVAESTHSSLNILNDKSLAPVELRIPFISCYWFLQTLTPISEDWCRQIQLKLENLNEKIST